LADARPRRPRPFPLDARAAKNQGQHLGNLTVIGAQGDDEGKGNIVAWLASRADR
jgi:hypothetical protein